MGGPRDEFLSEEDLDLQNLTDEELSAWWMQWLLMAQATNDADEGAYSHGAFAWDPSVPRPREGCGGLRIAAIVQERAEEAQPAERGRRNHFESTARASNVARFRRAPANPLRLPRGATGRRLLSAAPTASARRGRSVRPAS